MPLPSARFNRRTSAKARLGGRLPTRRVEAAAKLASQPPRDLAPHLASSQRPKCECGASMLVRKGAKAHVFWACPRFPVCKGRRSIDQQRFAAWQAQRGAAA
jgi:hypothetical protein